MASNDLHPRASVEDGDMIEKKPKKRRGLKWFIVDLWWVHLIVLVIGVIVVTLPVIYVVYPKVARQQVNSATLEVVDLSILDPRPRAFHINITTKLGTRSIFRPTLKPFEGTLVLPDGTPFLTLPVPTIHAKNGRLTVIESDITIPEERVQGFTSFSSFLVANETITTRLQGEGQLQLGKLPNTGVTYDKTLNLKGFNSLTGVTISDLSLLLTTQPDGATLTGRTTIPNPTIQTVQLGDLTLNLAIPAAALSMPNDTPIGYAMVNNTILYPGDNTFEARSVTNTTLIINILLQNPSFLTDGLPVVLRGNDVKYQGQSIEWLAQGLRQIPIRQSLDVASAITNAGLGGILTNDPGGPGVKTRREVVRRVAEVKGNKRRKLVKRESNEMLDDDLNGWGSAIKNAFESKNIDKRTERPATITTNTLFHTGR